MTTPPSLPYASPSTTLPSRAWFISKALAALAMAFPLLVFLTVLILFYLGITDRFHEPSTATVYAPLAIAALLNFFFTCWLTWGPRRGTLKSHALARWLTRLLAFVFLVGTLIACTPLALGDISGDFPRQTGLLVIIAGCILMLAAFPFILALGAYLFLLARQLHRTPLAIVTLLVTLLTSLAPLCPLIAIAMFMWERYSREDFIPPLGRAFLPTMTLIGLIVLALATLPALIVLLWHAIALFRAHRTVPAAA